MNFFKKILFPKKRLFISKIEVRISYTTQYHITNFRTWLINNTI
jgi:hypothetical protein